MNPRCEVPVYPPRVEPAKLEGIFQTTVARVRALVPEVELHLTGSASVAGLDADDIDFVGLVADVPNAAARLRAVYPPLYEAQWADDWAAFRSPGPPQVDLVLTTRGSSWDAHHRLAWQLLRSDDALLRVYSSLKQEKEGYAERKREFFERVVLLLPTKASDDF